MIRNTQLLHKGIVAVAVVAVAGIVGGVNFVEASHGVKPTKEECRSAGHVNYGQCVRVWAQDGSGYGNGGGEAALAASAAFQDAITESTDDFEAQVKRLSATAEAQLTPSGQAATRAFQVSFDESTAEYDATLATAFDKFNADVEAAAKTAESRNEFIDKFNRAKADYLNSLDAAKNVYASELSNMGNKSNVVKDQFMNGFNAARDAYSNQLEAAKNEFAATIQ